MKSISLKRIDMVMKNNTIIMIMDELGRILFRLKSSFKWRDCVFLHNTTSCLKNHWTKNRHVCTHFDAFFMPISIANKTSF